MTSQRFSESLCPQASPRPVEQRASSLAWFKQCPAENAQLHSAPEAAALREKHPWHWHAKGIL